MISLLPGNRCLLSGAGRDPPRDRPAAMTFRSRRAGISVPLFSLRSSRSWGIGEIGDILAAGVWLRSAHQSVLQILPLNELAPGESSPYSPLSAMAIDPQFISIWMLDDAPSLAEAMADEIEVVRRLPRVDYARVRELKARALRIIVRAVRQYRMASRDRQRGRVSQVHRAGSVVAGRIRLIQSAARGIRRAPMDRMAGRYSRSRCCGAREAHARDCRRRFSSINTCNGSRQINGSA